MKVVAWATFLITIFAAANHVSPVVQSKPMMSPKFEHPLKSPPSRHQFQGPSFTSTFPRKILTLNTEVTLLPCTVHSRPPATVEWLWYDEVASQTVGGGTGGRADDVYVDGGSSNWVPVSHSTSGLLEQLGNGSLAVLNFAEDSRLDRERLHVYRVTCRARNSVGVVVGPVVHIRPVVPSQYQMYTIQLMDVFIPVGNTAVFQCSINPYFMPEFVEVVTWQEENVDLTSVGGRYSILDHGDLKNGKLHVRNVSVADSYKKFRCLTRNTLTGKKRSSNPAHLIVIEASNSPPRVIDHVSSTSAVRGAKVELPCVAIAIPAARYRWSKGGTPLRHLPGHGRRGGDDGDDDDDDDIDVEEEDDDDDGTPGGNGSARLVGGNLEIENVQLGDSGDYRCVAENYIGHQGVSVRLSVTAPLSAHVEPQSQTVDSGREATLRCVVEGHPLESITWLKDGRTLMTSEAAGGGVKVEGREGSTLRIEKVKRSDAGMYQCAVRGGAGEVVHASAQVSLGAFPPLILNEMTSEYLDPGTRVSVACVAMGNPRPTITWHVDGELLPAGQHGDRMSVGDYVGGEGEVVSHVNVTGLKVHDGGRYECAASNEMGTQRRTATLNVFGVPHIKPMKNITALAGSELEVICRVTGYPVKEISWKKGSLLLPTNHRQATLSNGTLLVSRLNRHLDEGWYSCHVINLNDQGMERKFHVRVIEPPKIDPFNFPPRKQGDRVSVSCVMGSGDLPMTLEWRKDGDVIDPDLGVQVHQSGPYSSFLSIEYATPHHNGNYTCIVTNEGATASHTSLIHINVPPTWISEPEDTSSILAGTAVINCQAFGDPEPKILWKKSVGGIMSSYQDLDFRESRMTHLSNGSLVIESVAREDQGHYLCHASNNIPPDLSKVVHLTVNVPASFTVHDSNLSVSTGHSAVLECLAEGDLPTSLTWSSSSKDTSEWSSDPRYHVTYFPIDRGQGSRLTINHVNKEDSGFYVCMAKNNYGSDVTSIHVTVQQVPDPPFDLIGLPGVDWVELKWMQGFDGNSKVVEFLVEVCKETDPWKQLTTSLEVVAPSGSIRVQNLRPATSYKARLRARNSVGFSDPSEVVTFETLELEPSSPPVNVTAVAVGSQSVLVTWQPVPKSYENGRILGYSVGHRKLNSTSPYAYATVTNGYQRLLEDLEKFSTYSIHVRAFNRKGSGPSSEDVIVGTLEDVPSHAPLNVMASSHTPDTISVSWTPPPAYSLNGVLLGFKVIYKYVREDEDESDSRSQTTSDSSILLSGLKKSTNYSVQVLAHTRIGEGVASPPIYVTTLEDVPDAPEECKVVVMNSSAVIVAWREPARTNGRLVRYFVEVAALGDEKAVQRQIEVPPSVNTYLLTPVEPDRGHVLRVGATTAVGDGKTTGEIIIKTLDKAGAKIAGYSKTLNFQWQNTVVLDCLAGGIPEPIVAWEKDGLTIGTRDPSGKIAMETPGHKTNRNHNNAWKERTNMFPNGSLVISDLRGSDAGDYKCLARNQYGADEVIVTLTVQASPSPPILTVTSATFNSIQVTWKTASNGGSRIRGFRLFAKSATGDWSHVDLDPSDRSHLFNDLLCGSGYAFYIRAFNKMGMGLPSEEVVARTEGSAPIIPPQSMILEEVNSTSATLNLVTWETGGCPLASFDVAYRVADDAAWKTVREGILPNTTTFTVTLNPGTWYVMRVTAYNDAGSTECLLKFSTLTYLGGSTVEPQHLVRRINDLSFLSVVQKLHVAVPAAVALAVVFVVVGVAVGLFCYRRRSLKDEEKANTGLEIAMVVDDDVMDDQNETNELGSERKERAGEGKRTTKREEQQNLLKRGISKEWYARMPRDGFPDGSELQTAKNSADDLHRFLRCPQGASSSVSPSSCTCNGVDSGHSTMVTTSGRSSGGESCRMADPSGCGNHHHQHHNPQYHHHQQQQQRQLSSVQYPCVVTAENRDASGPSGSKVKERSTHAEPSSQSAFHFQRGRNHYHHLHQDHHHHHHLQQQLPDVPPVSMRQQPGGCYDGCHGFGDAGSQYAHVSPSTCTCSIEDRGFSPLEFPGSAQKRISRESESTFPPPSSSDHLDQRPKGFQGIPSELMMTSPSSSSGMTPAYEEFTGSPFHRCADVIT